MSHKTRVRSTVSKIRWMPRVVDKEVSVRGRATEKLIIMPEGFTDYTGNQ